MKSTYRLYVILMTLYFLTILLGCKKMLDVGPPINSVTTETTFDSDANAVSSVVGIYSSMMENRYSFGGGAITIYPALSSDEIISTFPDAELENFSNNKLVSTNGIIGNDIWRFGYETIYRANAIIEGVNASSNITEGVRKQLIGEAKFIRAFAHFYLAGLFGDIPVITSTDYESNASKARSAVTDVYVEVIRDLEEARTLLPEIYQNLGRTRPNAWSATALLARVYLYSEDFQKANDMATLVINSGMYSLSLDLNTVFLSGSSETIWQLYPVLNNQYGNNTNEGLFILPGCAVCPPYLRLRNSFYEGFEQGDLRKEKWIGKATINNEEYFYPYKYKVASNFPAAAIEYSVVLRLAEQYLIRATARAMLQKQLEAIADIDIIRGRAGLPLLKDSNPGIGQSDLLLAIEKEIKSELFVEWGHRWFDMKRSGRIDELLTLAKGSAYKPHASLYPIPFKELQLNPNLVQNAGY